MKKKILIIDDEPKVVLMLKTRLQANNYDVICAYSGKEGLRKTVEGKPDLIVLDILMPGKDGLAVLKELKSKELSKSIPVIILTARAGSSYLLKAQELGIEEYIVKPYDSQELLKCIKEHIG